MAKKIREERFSVGVSLAVAIAAFPVVCTVALFLVTWIFVAVANMLDGMGVDTMSTPEVILANIVWGVPLLLAYVASRVLYTHMRWQTVHDTKGRYCDRCGYDLTGNVSGRCPECGAGVAKRTD